MGFASESRDPTKTNQNNDGEHQVRHRSLWTTRRRLSKSTARYAALRTATMLPLVEIGDDDVQCLLVSVSLHLLFPSPKKKTTVEVWSAGLNEHARTAERDETVFVLVLLHERLIVDGDVGIRHCPWVGLVLFLESVKFQRGQWSP